MLTFLRPERKHNTGELMDLIRDRIIEEDFEDLLDEHDVDVNQLIDLHYLLDVSENIEEVNEVVVSCITDYCVDNDLKFNPETDELFTIEDVLDAWVLVKEKSRIVSEVARNKGIQPISNDLKVTFNFVHLNLTVSLTKKLYEKYIR